VRRTRFPRLGVISKQRTEFRAGLWPMAGSLAPENDVETSLSIREEREFELIPLASAHFGASLPGSPRRRSISRALEQRAR